MTSDREFPACPICKVPRWELVYEGRIRDGVWGRFRDAARVARCGTCGLERLDESSCLSAEAYDGPEYRLLLEQSVDVEAQHRLHDAMQPHNLELVLSRSPRGKSIADVGGGAGTFLDYLVGVAAEVALVEPMESFRVAARGRGIASFRDAREAIQSGRRFDLVTCFQVVEHVVDPVTLLAEMWDLVAPGGTLILTTPNRTDVLMELVPEFREFFYRTVHRWYFDSRSLEALSLASGFQDVRIRTQHRRNLANAFGWMSQRRPVGSPKVGCIDEAADLWWKGYLEQRGRGDTLVLEATHTTESSR